MELGESNETWHVFIITIYLFQYTDMALGMFLLRKLKEAITNHNKQQVQFSELLDACSEASSATAKWDLAIEEWEMDHRKPDPYEESECGQQYKYLT